MGSLRQQLRRMVADPELAKAKGAQARKDMVSRFTTRKLAEAVAGHVRRIEAKLVRQGVALEKGEL